MVLMIISDDTNFSGSSYIKSTVTLATNVLIFKSKYFNFYTEEIVLHYTEHHL